MRMRPGRMRPMRRAVRRQRRQIDVNPTMSSSEKSTIKIEQPQDTEHGTMEEPEKHQLQFGSIYVKFEDSSCYLVYSGDTINVANKKESILIPDKVDGFPAFSAKQGRGVHVIKESGIQITISTKYQIHMDESFEELRHKFYSTFFSNNSGDILDEKSSTNPKQEENFCSTHKLCQLVFRLLAVKKRSLSFVAMNLQGTIAQLSARMSKLCNGVESTRSAKSSITSGVLLNNCNEKPLSDGGYAETRNDSSSSRRCDVPGLDPGSCERSDICLHYALQANLLKSLEKLQDCFDVALNACERVESILNDLRDLVSPNVSFGKRFRKAALAELRCTLLLSFQVLKVQTLLAVNLNKISSLLESLYVSNKVDDSKESAKLPIATGTQLPKLNSNSPPHQKSSGSLDEASKLPNEENQAVLEEKPPMEGKTSGVYTSNLCQLCSDFQFDLGISELHRFLEVFVKRNKILRPLELSIFRLLCDFLQKEECCVPESVENIDEIFEELLPKEIIVLKHFRNPYKKQLALTNNKLKAAFVGGQTKTVLPHGEGRLSTLNNRVIYQGEWKEGKRNGYGKAFMAWQDSFQLNIGEYCGNWRSNSRHGFGRMVFSDGSVYEGEWYKDEIQGHGVMNRFDGCVLEGFWSGGNPNGCVTFSWPHGATEYREYKDGNILRVYDPRQELLPSIKTIKSLENVREETSYYKNYSRSLQGKVSSLKEQYNKKAKELSVQYQQENLQVVNMFQRELEDSQRLQKEKAQKTEELQRKLDCDICMTRPKDCVLLPCAHSNYCSTCVDELKARESTLKCPTCRQMTNGEIRLNFF